MIEGHRDRARLGGRGVSRDRAALAGVPKLLVPAVGPHSVEPQQRHLRPGVKGRACCVMGDYACEGGHRPRAHQFLQVVVEHPEIQSLTVPISVQEKLELGNDFNFGDASVYLGIKTYINYAEADVPPEVGRIVAYQFRGRYIEGVWKESYELLSSKECESSILDQHDSDSKFDKDPSFAGL